MYNGWFSFSRHCRSVSMWLLPPFRWLLAAGLLWLARLAEVYDLGRLRRIGFRRFLIGWIGRRGVAAEL